MAIEISSTTDSEDAVLAAMGGQHKAEASEDVEKSEAIEEAQKNNEPEEVDETTEDSDPSEKEEEDSDDDTSGDDDEEESEDEEKPRKKGKNGFKKRIDRLRTQREREAQARVKAEQEAEYWRRKALGDEPSKEPAPDKKTALPGLSQEPDPDDFEDHKDYVKALVKWERSQWELEQKQQSLKSEYETKRQSLAKSIQEFAKAHDDFNDRVKDVDHVVMSPTVEQVILSLGAEAPALIYELASDPEEYERICTLPPIDAARELGRVEARIRRQSESPIEKKRKLSKAPPPPKPVTGKSQGSLKKSILDEDLSQAEYERLRMEQRKAY